MTSERSNVLDLDDLIQRYANRESLSKIADETGISYWSVRKALMQAGVKIRTPQDYPAHVAEAHAARRGQRDSLAVKEARARTRQTFSLGTSLHEDAFAVLLDAAEVMYCRQFQLGPYNLDFALTEVPVAVELRGGGQNPQCRANRRHRIEYILDSGLTLIEVSPKGTPGSSFVGAADYVIALVNELRRKPSSVREHRMIRPDGKPLSQRCVKNSQWPVPPRPAPTLKLP